MNLRRLVFAFVLFPCACDDGGDGEGGGSTGTSGTTSVAESTSTAAGGSTGTPATSTSTTTTTGADPESSSTSAGDESSTSTTGTTSGLVVIETTMGTMTLELFHDDAPVTVENFLAYIDAGFYDGSDGLGETVFHRVIPGFVIQGGGLTESLDVKTTMAPIINEHEVSGLTNDRGTLSMARTSDPNSATSQFFVNLVDNANLDQPPGYAVFARVVEGMDVVDAIAGVSTGDVPPYADVPMTAVRITSVTLE